MAGVTCTEAGLNVGFANHMPKVGKIAALNEEE